MITQPGNRKNGLAYKSHTHMHRLRCDPNSTKHKPTYAVQNTTRHPTSHHAQPHQKAYKSHMPHTGTHHTQAPGHPDGDETPVDTHADLEARLPEPRQPFLQPSPTQACKESRSSAGTPRSGPSSGGGLADRLYCWLNRRRCARIHARQDSH